MEIKADIELLREMVRLAEKRRDEELASVERTNRYNLAIIAFSGSFLSLLISTDQEILVTRITGFILIVSILSCLIALKPRVLKGGALTVDEDVKLLRSEQKMDIKEYLLDTAEYTEMAADSLSTLAHHKKFWTILSAVFLALSLFSAYIFVGYA